jgi:hypothetical protein
MDHYTDRYTEEDIGTVRVNTMRAVSLGVPPQPTGMYIRCKSSYMA